MTSKRDKKTEEEDAPKEEILRQKRDAAKTQFTRKVKLFRNRVDKGDVYEALDFIFKDVDRKYCLLELACEKMINFYSNKCFDQSVIDEAEEYLYECEQTKCDVYNSLLHHRTTVETGIKQNTQPLRLKLEALKLPKFNGCVRDFPGFLDDFNSIVIPSCGKNPAVLKQCLEGDPLKSIIGCERDYDKMLKVLKEVYGDPRKLVDEVISDLKELNYLTNIDEIGFIDMVKKVEKCFLDLKRVSLEKEMNCVNIVSMIESVLPKEKKHRWILRSQNITESNNYFPELLEFLKNERKVVEYCLSSVRTGEKQKRAAKVNICHDSESQIFHMIRKLQEDQNNTQTMLNQVCSKLNNAGVNNNNAHGSRWCWVHELNGHDISTCGKFRSLTASERMELVKRKGICFICLEGGHLSKNCTKRQTCTIQMEGIQCNRRHHPLLHDGFPRNVGSVSTSGCSVRQKVLLDVTTVYSSQNIPIKVLWDSGSNISLITHKMARKLNCRGVPVSGTMTKVGNIVESFNSKEYCVKILDKYNQVHEVVATGIDEIAGQVGRVDLSKLSSIFPSVNLRDINRPYGEIDMLIGTDYSIFLPHPVAEMNRLEVTENIFGRSIRGCLPLGYDISGNLGNLAVTARINHVSYVMKFGITDIERDEIKEKLDKFFDIDSSGVTCEPQCIRCLCRKCPIYENKTIKEERELEVIEKGLQYDEDNKEWRVTYPWIKNPNLLPNNYEATLGRLKSTERRLMLDVDNAEAYKREMKDLQMRGVARKLEVEEIKNYRGPVHYIAHHAVLKPDSQSTPVRIVFDASTRFMGHRLNDYWAKGPNILNNLLGILLRFRKNEVGLVGDISKMYHSVKLESKEEHVHRFLWRDMEVTREPDHFVLTRVTFGDRPSGVIATLALRYTAEMQRESHPLVAQIINEDTYMDDMLTSVDNASEAKNLAKEIESVLLEGGFKVKHWTMSGEAGDVNLLEENVHKVLGMRWITLYDEFMFKVKINFSKRVKKVHTQTDLIKTECETNFPERLTRRMVLSQVASIYDPLGLILPYLLKAKLLMRSLITKDSDIENNRLIDWDEPMDDNLKEQWKAFFIGLYDIQDITFPRCIKPPNTVGKPILILFSDASNFAYGCCAYIRWDLKSGISVTKLLTAKNRIAPKKQITIPRLELCGAVLSARLRQFVVEELKIEFKEILHIVDSTIVRAQIQKETHNFKTFVAVRIAEIQSKTNVNEWWWIDSSNNAADILTKPCKPSELSKGSLWQDGPNFLKQPRHTWPIFQDNISTEVNEDMIACMELCRNNSNISSRLINLDIDRFNSFKKLIRVTARVLAVFRSKSLKAIKETPKNELMNEAERLWIIEAQKDISDGESRYKTLGPSLENGVLVVGCRIQPWLKENWNRDNFILLPTKHLLTKLIVTDMHNETHEGIETILAKLSTKYWIPGVRKLIKAIKGKCVQCRKLEKKLEDQCMGQISEERLKPTPPFYHTATDIFGPFAIRDSVKRRTYGKCFGVIFTCLASRAVHLDLTENYSTEAFLGALQRFTSIRGCPYSIHSDNGTQMIAANKELVKISNMLEKDKLQDSAKKNKILWSFNRSSDAPWLNGSCESLIKSVKMSIQKAIGESILTYAEFQTVLLEVATIVNSRPIGIKPCYDIELGNYLCPNDLLLGRSTNEAPFGNFEACSGSQRRFQFIQCVINNFWKRWQRDYFPTLIVRKKWHTKLRNIQVGDVVLVQDANTVRGNWKMGEVVSTNTGRDKLVRDVTIRYKVCTEGVKYNGERNKFMKRSVHRLVVLLPVEER